MPNNKLKSINLGFGQLRWMWVIQIDWKSHSNWFIYVGLDSRLSEQLVRLCGSSFAVDTTRCFCLVVCIFIIDFLEFFGLKLLHWIVRRERESKRENENENEKEREWSSKRPKFAIRFSTFPSNQSRSTNRLYTLSSLLLLPFLT